MKEEKETKEVKKDAKIIKPLKDFKFACGKDVYDLKKGVEIEVPKRFLSNLKTEKVIK